MNSCPAGSSLVQREIALAPVEVSLREIEAGRPRSRLRRAHREAAGVGEDIEDSHGRFAGSPIGAAGKSAATWRVSKRRRLSRWSRNRPDGIAFGEAELELHAVLANVNRSGAASPSTSCGEASARARGAPGASEACGKPRGRRSLCQPLQFLALRRANGVSLCDNRKSPSRSTYQPGQPSLAP